MILVITALRPRVCKLQRTGTSCGQSYGKIDPPLISGLPEISNLNAQVGYSRLGCGGLAGRVLSIDARVDGGLAPIVAGETGSIRDDVVVLDGAAVLAA
jgi:hypothetical protein